MGKLRAPKTDCAYVYDNLRADIISGRIKANERILERDYAEKLGVSRTPVREALRLLERDGLVDFRPKKGATAHPLLQKSDVEEIFQLRALLQLHCAEDTVHNITEDELKIMRSCNQACDAAVAQQDCRSFFQYYDHFNSLLIRSCRKSFVIRLLTCLDGFDPMTSITNAEEDEVLFSRISVSTWERREEALGEHKDILDALAARDISRYKTVLRIHIENSNKVCMNGLYDFPLCSSE